MDSQGWWQSQSREGARGGPSPPHISGGHRTCHWWLSYHPASPKSQSFEHTKERKKAHECLQDRKNGKYKRQHRSVNAIQVSAAIFPQECLLPHSPFATWWWGGEDAGWGRNKSFMESFFSSWNLSDVEMWTYILNCSQATD